MIIRRMGFDYTTSTETKGVPETVTLIYIYLKSLQGKGVFQ